MDGVPAPVDWTPGDPLALRLYLDGAGLELLTGDGLVSVTRVVDLPVGGMEVEVFARNGRACIQRYDRWEMKSIW